MAARPRTLARTHRRLVLRKSLLTEREREIAVTVALLGAAFALASFGPRPPSVGVVAGIVLLALAGATFGVYLVIRNHRRSLPLAVDTRGRWVCEQRSLAEIRTFTDYHCRIPRAEHRKGPAPQVRLEGAEESDYLVRIGADGDVAVFFAPSRIAQISTAPPVRLLITG